VKETVTDYIGGLIYQQDSLQQISHEEGRIRMIYATGQPVQYTYDYFVKDHLGNVRMVLTEQTQQNIYLASMETANAATENALFSNIDNTRTDKPVGYPVDESGGSNNAVAKLTALNGGKKIGPSLVLRVMAGDTIQIGAKAFYKSTYSQKKNSPTVPAEAMLTDLIQAFNGSTTSAEAHNIAAAESATPFNSNFYNNDYQRLKEKEPDQQNPDRPKAYLNFVLFDDQFNLVEENSGVKQVKAEPDQLQTLAQDKMPVKTSGFLYVYTSNESPQDVFFDNVAVVQASGPVLEETHYYPFGLTMAGISSNALKGANYSKNRKEFNGIEHTTDLDLNQYDAFCRTLDPQLGRWWQIDPKPNDAISLYATVDNNPIRYSDFLGDTAIAGAGFWRNAWEGLKDGGRATASWVKSLGTAEGIGNTLDGMAAMSPFNVDEGSVGARTQMIDNAVNYVGDIPNKTKDQVGHDVGYGVEKLGETVFASKGSSIISNAFKATAFVDMAAEAEIVTPLINSRGVPYPRVSVSGYGEVPFPEGPYVPNNSLVLRSSFTTGYKAEFRNWWTEQGRPWPTAPEGSSINIHHIKPLKFGGTNAFENLVPLVQPLEHQPFTNWWRNFSH
jgi:RHS repeat-associated protein